MADIVQIIFCFSVMPQAYRAAGNRCRSPQIRVGSQKAGPVRVTAAQNGVNVTRAGTKVAQMTRSNLCRTS